MMLCVCLLFTSSLFAQQQVDFTLKYNTVTSEYEVYGKPTLTGSFSTGGGSQLTVMTPASLADAPITITSVEGGPWADNTQMYAPSAQTSTDFHSITTNGTAPNISFVAGVEKLIYKFTLPGGCVAGIRLFRNVAEGAAPADPDSNVPGMAGNDFQNYFAPVQTGNQEYRANYANTGTTCVVNSSDLITSIGQPATPFVAGSPSNVPVTVTNIGTAPDAGPINTTITLPAGFSAPASFPTVAGTTCTTAGQIVTCVTTGPLSQTAPNNAVVINIPVTPAASTVGVTPTPTTTATTSSPNEPATNTTNNPATPMSPTTPVAAAPAPDLITSIGQPATPFVAGSPSNVPVTVTNIGTAPDAGPINTTITLPAGFSAPASFPTVAGTTCTTAGQIVTCVTTGPLSQTAPNNAVVINIPVTPAASTVGVTPTPTTTATTSSPNEPATNTTNNPATPMSPTTPVAAAPAPDLITSIGQPLTPFVAGSPSNVPVTVTNIGTAPANGPINTTITLPAGFSAPPSFPTVAGTTCTTAGQIVTCSTTGPLSQTAPNNAVVINIPVTPAASTVGTSPTTTATTSAPNETNTANNPATPMSPTTPVTAAPAPDLITSIGQPATPFVAGSPSNVPVTVTNIGTAPANGPINTTITLPAGFSAPPSFPTVAGTTCTTAGQIVTCSTTGPLSQTAPNNAVVINIPVTPAASTVGTSPTTTATTSAPNETNTTNNPATPMSPTTPVTAAPAPDLITSIGQPATPFVAGTPSNVPVTVTNIGTAPANGPINTTITLPAGFSAPASFPTVAGTTCTTAGQIVTCSTTGPLSQTAPNNAVVINIPVTPAPSTVGTSPTTTATTSAPNETNTTNNPATPMSPTTPVAAAPVVSVKLNVKLFLQGAYDQATGLMRDDLRSRGFLPTAQPYTAMARTSYHTGTETTTAAVLAATGSNAIVDWVLLELRTGTGVATRVATRAALVQRDGDIVDMDGISPVTFSNRAAASYYVVATHRNHLGVMSEVAVALSATPATCDFTGAYDGFGNHAMKAIGNLNALWAGNSNHTGITHRSLIFSGANNDPDAVKNDVLTAGGNSAQDFSFVPTGYKLGDTNLDGDVKYQGPKNDVDAMIFFNVLSHPANTVTSPLYLVAEQH
jgi:hypothetical protein